MTYLTTFPNARIIAVGLGLLAACGPTVDSETSASGASGTGSTSDEVGTETARATTTEGDSNSTNASTGTLPTSESSSGGETTGAPAPVCGGECFADAVASAYLTCQSDLEDFPCDAPHPCPAASAECDVNGENCVFEKGNADTYVQAVACVFDAILDASPGRYTLRYGQQSLDRKQDAQWDVLNVNVQSDGSVQTFFAGPAPFEGGLAVDLRDVELSCVQDQLEGVLAPVEFAPAVSVVSALSQAVGACNELCLQVFEGNVQFPSDLPCE